MQMSTEFNQQVGRRVKVLRTERGLTQRQLADRADVSSQTISNLERGSWGINFSTAVHLARALDVSVEDLIE